MTRMDFQYIVSVKYVLVHSIPPTNVAAALIVMKREEGIGFELFIFTDRRQLMGNRIGNVTFEDRIERKEKKNNKNYTRSSRVARALYCNIYDTKSAKT